MKIRNSQAHLYYSWYLDECTRSEKLRVEITVLKRNQKVNTMSKQKKFDKFEMNVVKCVAAIIIVVAVSSMVAKGIISFAIF